MTKTAKYLHLPNNDFLLNLACRRPRRFQNSNTLLMFGRSSNATTSASTLTQGRLKGATGVLCAGKLTMIRYYVPYWPFCRQKGLRRNLCFFTGGVSTLRSHISRYIFDLILVQHIWTIIYRYDDHTKLYKERCAKLGISMNSRALPKEDDQSLSRQGTLDGTVVVQSRVLPFTTTGLLDYIVELVVCEDEVF